MGSAVAVHDLNLRRGEGIFTLNGTVCLLAPIEGKVTGGVFTGTGSFVLEPQQGAEQHSLAMLTKSGSMHEDFSEMVMRFTDGSEKELSPSGAGAGGNCDSGPMRAASDVFRKKLRYNIAERLLEDVLSPQPGGLFVALIKGQHFSSKMLFAVDPHGAFFAEPDAAGLMTYDDMKSGVWVAYTPPATRSGYALHIDNQNLDTRIEHDGRLTGNAATTFEARSAGLRVVAFDLFPTLRVQKVTDDSGAPLSFIQEDKDDDPQFAVVLPKALDRGDKFTVHTIYSGKEAVVEVGSGNYFPVARSNWYPNSEFGEYENYTMRFSVPKNMTMVATGTRLSEQVEGDQSVTTWKSEGPQSVAGFNLGVFKRVEAPVPNMNFTVESYANERLPDGLTGPFGTLSTVALMKKPLAEAELAVGIYTDYFGPTPYKRLAMTQQFACSFGQSWPTLVYLPMCSFFDDTQRHFMGLDDTRGYWQVVAPHEVAHQWWGHTVGFRSYRDQWMSEGFADLSASIFIQAVNEQHGPGEFIKFWKDERDLLTERNSQGWRAIDAGPLTMGYRLNNDKSGSIARRLIYPKGAFVLHMLRMMMWDPKTGDTDFKAMMHDFVQTYTDRAATTEDFKAIVEKHMKGSMDAAADHKMNWFFNQYVYGTALPAYKAESSMGSDAQGPVVHFSITQSNVTPDFRMPVPVYAELADGKVRFVGRLLLVGNNTVKQDIPLQSAGQIKRLTINYYEDVLSTEAK